MIVNSHVTGLPLLEDKTDRHHIIIKLCMVHVRIVQNYYSYRILNPSLRWYLRDRRSYTNAREDGTFGVLPSLTTLKKYKNIIPGHTWLSHDFLN